MMQMAGGVTSIMAEKMKKKKDGKAITKKILKISLNSFIALMTVLTMLVSIFIIWVFSGADYEFISNVHELINLKLNTTIYCMDNATGKYVVYDMIKADENRIWVDIENITPDMQNAIVAIEDERFYVHSGVDLKRTTGAVINELKGGSTYGGSTLTQQLVKNLTGDNEHSRLRKVREILRAISLETKLSKSEILELYLNTIYLGQNCYGIETAANRYFDKSASELTLAESACIAGITQFPSEYDPIVNPEKNEQKRLLVLKKMYELGYITKDQYDEAKETELKFSDKLPIYSDGKTSYFTDFVIEQAIGDLMEKNKCTRAEATVLLYNGGYKIYATIDTKVQNAMDKVYSDPNNRDYFIKNYNGVGVQSSMVICDPYTGQVKGMVGGVGQKQSQLELNRATQTKRQPGSSIKPLSVYAPAIDTGTFSAASLVRDNPIKIGNWTPKNDNGKFNGHTTVRNAIMWSRNIPAINIVNELSPTVSSDYLTRKFHMTTITKDDINLSAMALGGMTNGVTVLEMTAAYNAFVNDGNYLRPIAYTKIENTRGEVIIDNTSIAPVRAIGEDTAFIMRDMMKGVVSSGTGAGAKIDGMATAGKTGTTDQSQNRWFAGYTPYYCGVTWYGYDKPEAVRYSATGRNYSRTSNPALNIWKAVMAEIHEDLPDKEFKDVPGVEKRSTCPYSGKLASSRCPGAGYDYVTKQAASSSYCTLSSHYLPKLDYETEIIEEEDEEDEEGNEGEEGEETGENTEGDTPSSDEPTESPSAPPVTIPSVPPAPSNEDNKPTIEF